MSAPAVVVVGALAPVPEILPAGDLAALVGEVPAGAIGITVGEGVVLVGTPLDLLTVFTDGAMKAYLEDRARR